MRKIISWLLVFTLCTTNFSVSARFLSVDPVQPNQVSGANFNRYGYSNNNPYRFTDPDGRQSREFNWENQKLGIKPPPRSPDDRLGPAIGVALSGMLIAPAVGFAGPGLATTAADVAMGDALGGASLGVGSTTLYRVVDSVELNSINDLGGFLPAPNGDSVKRFLDNLPDAKALAERFGQKWGNQHVVEGLAPKGVMDASSRTQFSDVPGRAMESINIPNEQLPNVKCVGKVDGC